jgi:LmbE family N-acetylglucosaminyl deacetylase
MEFHRDDAVLHVPDGVAASKALARTTHLGIGAHQDDLEIMAIDGILKCYAQTDAWFTGVVVSDGAGAPRSGPFAGYTNEQMVETRIEEQKRAADIGLYGAQIILLHPSDELKEPNNARPVDDIEAILRATRPEVVYTHNLFDKHDVHVAVALRVIAAIRRLPSAERPNALFGCEVWRDLDWLPTDRKLVFDTSAHEDLQFRLLEVFESQVAGGKRYDLAAMGRRRANATYLEPHQVDAATGAVYADDMTSLIRNPVRDPLEYARAILDQFATDVASRIQRLA